MKAQRHPEVGNRIGSDANEVRRRDADDRQPHAFELDGLADGLLGPAERTHPVRVADHGDSAALIALQIAIGERASTLHRDAERREVLTGDKLGQNDRRVRRALNATDESGRERRSGQ